MTKIEQALEQASGFPGVFMGIGQTTYLALLNVARAAEVLNAELLEDDGIGDFEITEAIRELEKVL